ncbi:MAG TPA: hypothetical protein VMV51_00810 [Gemmatimonadaceae bacterium]|nr:hypothetical protein [Gemmatimonadaceae bacterium]
MNRQKIVIAGLVAGLVLNVIDFVSYRYLLGAHMARALDAVNPALNAAMSTGRAMATSIVIDFLLGIALVWLYAAMRPRYGAGPRNALMSAFFVWLISSFAYSMFHTMGMMSTRLWLVVACMALVSMSIGALVGGKLYSE